MNDDEILEAWRRRRAAPLANVDLAGRVMQAIGDVERTVAHRGALLVLLARVAASRRGRISLCLAALSLGLLRFVYLAMAAALISF